METEINLGNKYNYEKDISMTIELDKTCYSKGELIHGIITLTPKENSNIKELLNPYAVISFQEKQNYEFLDSFYDKDRDILKPTKRNINEIISLDTIPMDFSKYANANMLPNLKIPFEVHAPKSAYPSCLFESNIYVIHFLTCEFESLKVKKSVIIIIKNSPYFTKENGLLKTPAIYKQIIEKHKFAVFSCGYFELKITLDKNICPYNENLPIKVDIDCKNLSLIKLQGVKIYIYRKIKKNNIKNKKVALEEKIEEIVRKTLPLREGGKLYHVEDEIKLPISSNDLNPDKVYKILDKDKREEKLKFFNIKLFPSCDGGLLSCQYYIKIIIETNTLFSTNEEMLIPIDFYSVYKEEKNDSNNINNKNKIGEKINLEKQKENDELKDEENIEDNLNINLQVFYNDFNSKEKDNEKSNDNNKENDKYEGFEILHNFDE